MQKLSYEYHSADSNVMLHGEMGDKMYLIIDGTVGVWKPAPKHRQSLKNNFKALQLENIEVGHGREISLRGNELDSISEHDADDDQNLKVSMSNARTVRQSRNTSASRLRANTHHQKCASAYYSNDVNEENNTHTKKNSENKVGS